MLGQAATFVCMQACLAVLPCSTLAVVEEHALKPVGLRCLKALLTVVGCRHVWCFKGMREEGVAARAAGV